MHHAWMKIPRTSRRLIDLEASLAGGQAFRWRLLPSTGTVVGPFGGAVVELGFDEASGLLQCRRWDTNTSLVLSEAAVASYLSLDRDLDELWREWTTGRGTFNDHSLVQRLGEFGASYSGATAAADEINKKVSPGKRGRGKKDLLQAPFGLRILRQDLHETLFSFICSQNNNVKRIAGMIDRLCEAFGTKIPINQKIVSEFRQPPPGASNNGSGQRNARKRSLGDDGDKSIQGVIPSAFYTFPTLEQLLKATEDDLRALGFGYRSDYIVQTCRKIAASIPPPASAEQKKKNRLSAAAAEPQIYADLRRRDLSIDEKRRLLMSLHGVGRKVCDCILLFSLDERSVVPIDTHMAQIATEHFLRSAAQTQLLSKHIDKKHAVALVELKKRAADKDQPPSLLPKHHDALQQAFRAVFGGEAGWAHSFLFFDRLNA